MNVTVEQYHAVIAVADLGRAVEFYSTKLGFVHAFSWGEPPTMAGVNLGETQIFLQCGTPAPEGCSLYYVIDDADALCEFHRANGVEIVEAIGDRSWDFRDYTIRDLNGYRLTFGHRLPERAEGA
jgi:catechol 2,3-dioxygenase-like lactoylglutathione lyase family enzyme